MVRTVARGGEKLTETLADRLGMSLRDAEQAKCEVGLTGRTGGRPTALNEAIRPLLAEIRSSIHYFGSTNDGAPLERISLTGGGSQLPGFADALGEQIGRADRRGRPRCSTSATAGRPSRPRTTSPTAAPAPCRSVSRWEQRHDRHH